MNLRTLEHSLHALRQTWPQAWPGLPQVVRACVAQLGPVPANRSCKSVLDCALVLAQKLERHGERLGDVEPPYHNRLHTADTLVSLTVLLHVQRRVEGIAPTTSLRLNEALMLLAMLGHDAWHPGTRNRYPFELEQRSSSRLCGLMRAHGLSARAQAEVERLILATEPEACRQAQRLPATRACSLKRADCRVMLVREADVLSSALPRFAPALTRALAQEWSMLDLDMGQRLLAPRARQRFLRDMARFESSAALALGLPALVQAQLR